MSNLVERLELLITSTAHGVASDIEGIGSASQGSAGKVGLIQSSLQKLGVQGKSTGDMVGTGLKLGAAAGVMAIADMAVHGVSDFQNLTGEVRAYQRVLGGSAEDSSKLAFAVREVGIDAQTAQSGFGQLAKRIGEGKDTLADWNVKVVRAKDGTLDMAGTIENLAARYQELHSPEERAAFLNEEFGKSGQKLAPLLSKSREELQKFYEEAAKDHQVFSQDDLNKGKDLGLAIKAVEEAGTGLAIELAQELVPSIKFAAETATTVLHVLDDVGNALGGVALGGIAAGAGLGAMIGGPWGAAIGAGIGLLGSLAGSEASVTDQTHKMAGALAQADAKKLIHDFEGMSIVRGFADDVGSATAKLRTFKTIAEDNVGTGQRLIDALKGEGVSTADLQKVLDGVVGKKKEQKRASDETKAAEDALSGSTRGAALASKALEQAQKDLLKAEDELQNSLLGAPGALLNYEQALQSQTDAQKAYDDAVAANGPSTQEADAALLTLQGAQQNTGQSALSLDAANQKLVDTFKNATPAAIQAEIDRLHASMALHPEAAASLQPLIDRLQALHDQYSNLPAEKHTTIHVDTAQANADLQVFLANLQEATRDRKVTVSVGVVAPSGQWPFTK